MGWIRDPKKAAYNWAYKRATVSGWGLLAAFAASGAKQTKTNESLSSKYQQQSSASGSYSRNTSSKPGKKKSQGLLFGILDIVSTVLLFITKLVYYIVFVLFCTGFIFTFTIGPFLAFFGFEYGWGAVVVYCIFSVLLFVRLLSFFERFVCFLPVAWMQGNKICGCIQIALLSACLVGFMLDVWTTLVPEEFEFWTQPVPPVWSSQFVMLALCSLTLVCAYVELFRFVFVFKDAMEKTPTLKRFLVALRTKQTEKAVATQTVEDKVDEWVARTIKSDNSGSQIANSNIYVVGSRDYKFNGNAVDAEKFDPLFVQAAQFVVLKRSGSTSSLQRRFNIGYSRASEIMNQLEQAGIVRPAMGAGPREIRIANIEALDALLQNLGYSKV